MLVGYSKVVKSTWNALDDFMIVKGVIKHGFGSYKQIIEDGELWSTGLDEEEKQGEASWKKLLRKISNEIYQEEVLAESEVQSAAHCYIADYLNTRLLYIVAETESSKFAKE